MTPLSIISSVVAVVFSGVIGGFLTYLWWHKKEGEKGAKEDAKHISRKVHASDLTDAQQTEQIRQNKSNIVALTSRVDGFDERHRDDLESLRRAGGTDAEDKVHLRALQVELEAARRSIQRQHELILVLVRGQSGDVNVLAAGELPLLEGSEGP